MKEGGEPSEDNENRCQKWQNAQFHAIENRALIDE